MSSPRKSWYAVGALLIAVGIIGGAALFIAGFAPLVGRTPHSEHTFSSNGSATVHIDAGQSKMIYATSFDNAITCEARDVTGRSEPDVARSSLRLTLNGWRPLFTVTAHSDGDYTIRCSGSDVRYGVGETISSARLMYPYAGAGLGALLALAGVVVTVVTWFRRRRARMSQLWPAATQPYGAGIPEPANEAIAVTTRHHPMMWTYGLYRPSIAVDGRPVPVRGWGRTVLPVPPGVHQVQVCVPPLGFRRRMIGFAETSVPVAPGQLVELEYKAPVFGFAGAGALGAPPQLYSGAQYLTAMVLVPFAISIVLTAVVVIVTLLALH